MNETNLQTLRSAGVNVFKEDWGELCSRYPGNSFLNLDPLYALPADLLASLAERLPDWLSSEEVQFEQDLGALCRRHHCLGFFLGQTIVHPCIAKDMPLPTISEDVFQLPGWASFYNSSRHVMLQFHFGIKRIDLLRDRMEAYIGWLLTNARFLDERDTLRLRWQDFMHCLGRIPSYPVGVEESIADDVDPPADAKDVTAEFVSSLKDFFDRWELESMATWDLPVPRGVNLSGIDMPAFSKKTSTITFDFNPVLMIPETFSLNKMMAEIQIQGTAPHLSGWLAIQKNQAQGGLGCRRYQNLFRLHFYRDIVLASRYTDRFRANIEALDEVFAKYLGGLSADSVKKLRRHVSKMRQISK